jgi:hypothetical protein
VAVGPGQQHETQQAIPLLEEATAWPEQPAQVAGDKAVNLYKVGHHGSLNATPKSLWKLFEHKGPANTEDRLQTVVSTMAGKHGSARSGTEVPRSKLVDELKRDSDFVTTQSLKRNELCHEVEIEVT